MNPIQIAPERWLVQTSCHQCFIEIEHSKVHDEFRWLTIGLLSTHVGWWNGRLRTRLREAWRILRGDAYTVFELLDAEEAEALVTALEQARSVAFGYSSTHQRWWRNLTWRRQRPQRAFDRSPTN